jgi:hypothetical protein
MGMIDRVDDERKEISGYRNQHEEVLGLSVILLITELSSIESAR